MLLENMLLMAAGEVEVEEPLEASTENFLYVWGQHVPFLMVDTPSTPKSWTAIAFGTAHAIGIQSNGTLWSWGNDGSTGALGRTYRTNHPESPTQIGTASNWSSVGAGEYVSAAITNTGALYMWGRNTNGQLGQGNITNRSSPVVVSGTWSKIVCGLSHVLAIKSDGKLFAWGWNGQGQLGDGTTLGRSSPVQIGASNWLDIGGGQSHTLAIRSDSKLFAWGGNAFGQVSSTKDVTPSWKQISAGYTHTLAIDQNGGLWAWGSNSNGQIGAFVSGGFASTPVRPTGTSFSSYTMVSAGYLYSTAIRVDGRLQVWGVNSVGQLGDGARLQVSSPKLVHNASYVFVAAAQGTGGHTHAINTLGQLISWGQGSQGQLGHGLTGTLASRSSPVLITTPTYSYIAVASGQSSSVAITENSTQYCLTWGGSASGEGGRNNFTTYSRPTLIFEGSTRSWVKCAIGATHVSAVANGDAFLWGNGSSGQLGRNNTFSSSSPFPVVSSVADVALGTNHSLVLQNDGTIKAFGANQNGQLGDNTNISKSVPITVSGGLSFAQVTASTFSGGLISVNGPAYFWALNNSSQLGLGDFVNRSVPTLLEGNLLNSSSPVQIGTDNWTKVACGTNHSVAIRSDSKLFTWGVNSSGQLGHNNTVSLSIPTQVGTDNYTEIVGTNAQTFAIRSDSKLFGMGQNSSGSLGDGTFLVKSSPVQIGTDNWSSLPRSHTNNGNAIRSDGIAHTTGTVGATLFFDGMGPQEWNPNVSGIASARRSVMTVLGNARYNYSKPTLIDTTQTSWTMMKVGGLTSNQYFFGIKSNGTLWSWGYNLNGELGHGDLLFRSVPTQVGALSGWTWITATDTRASLGIRNSLLFSWGLNLNGELGNGNRLARSSPVQIGADSWNQVEGGASHVVALDQFGRVFAWGAGASGRLGNSSNISRSSPVVLANVFSAKNVAAGFAQSGYISNTDKVLMWGINTAGQIGDGTRINRSSPVTVAASTRSFTHLAIGANSSYGIDIDKKLWSWGSNSLGELGNPNLLSRSSPVQVGAKNWKYLGANGNHAWAIEDFTNKLHTWGRGPLGVDPTFTLGPLDQIWNSTNFAYSQNRSEPTAVQADVGFSGAYIGRSNGMAW